jgi:hypothetical protein
MEVRLRLLRLMTIAELLYRGPRSERGLAVRPGWMAFSVGWIGVRSRQCAVKKECHRITKAAGADCKSALHSRIPTSGICCGLETSCGCFLTKSRSPVPVAGMTFFHALRPRARPPPGSTRYGMALPA